MLQLTARAAWFPRAFVLFGDVSLSLMEFDVLSLLSSAIDALNLIFGTVI